MYTIRGKFVVFFLPMSFSRFAWLLLRELECKGARPIVIPLNLRRRVQVKKEWCHPIKRNSFALPFLCFTLMSWLATKWSGESFSGDLAKVLFWLGTAPQAAMTLFTIGRFGKRNAIIVCRLAEIAETSGQFSARPPGILEGETCTAPRISTTTTSITEQRSLCAYNNATDANIAADTP